MQVLQSRLPLAYADGSIVLGGTSVTVSAPLAQGRDQGGREKVPKKSNAKKRKQPEPDTADGPQPIPSDAGLLAQSALSRVLESEQSGPTSGLTRTPHPAKGICPNRSASSTLKDTTRNNLPLGDNLAIPLPVDCSSASKPSPPSLPISRHSSQLTTTSTLAPRAAVVPPAAASKRLKSAHIATVAAATTCVPRPEVDSSAATTATLNTLRVNPPSETGLIVPPTASSVTTPGVYQSVGAIPNLVRSSLRAPDTTASSQKRFKPLIMKKTVSSGRPSACQQSTSNPSRSEAFSLPQSSFLQLPVATNPPALGPITLPPSLSHRKRVASWAIILCQLSDSDRRQCALVSRLFRYSGNVQNSGSHVNLATEN